MLPFPLIYNFIIPKILYLVNAYTRKNTFIVNVSINSNFDTAYDEYIKSLNPETVEIANKFAEINGVVTEIRSMNINGTTSFYLFVNGQVYSVSAKDNEKIILVNVGNSVPLTVEENATGEIIPAKLK